MDLVEGLFPAGRIHLLGGAAGSGKTTVLAWMLRRIQAGQTVFGRKSNPPTGMYYIAADRRWDEYSTPLLRSKLNLTGYYSYADDLQMTFERFANGEPEQLLRHGLLAIAPKPGSVVVVDVLGLFLGDDLRKYRPIMAYLWAYNRWCEELGITLFGTVHAGKQRGTNDRYVRLFDRVMGAGALRATSSTAMYLTTKEETGMDKGYQELEIIPRDECALTHQMLWDVDGLLKPDSGAVSTLVMEALGLVPVTTPGIGSEALATQIQVQLKVGRSRAYELISTLADDGYMRRLGASRKAWWVKAQAGEA